MEITKVRKSAIQEEGGALSFLAYYWVFGNVRTPCKSVTEIGSPVLFSADYGSFGNARTL